MWIFEIGCGIIKCKVERKEDDMTIKVTYIYKDEHPRVEYRECSGRLMTNEICLGVALFDYEEHRALLPPVGGSMVVEVV